MEPPLSYGGGTVDFTYGLDGTLASRATPNGLTAVLEYDAAKRPTEVSFGSSSLTRAYDRAGNVTADGRSLSGVSGDAGSGTAAYVYDALGRLVEASGLSRDDEFGYDRNGNRLTKVEGSTTATYVYDRTDQLVEQTVGSDTTAFAYNGWGDLTTSVNLDGDTTAHVYDAGGRLISLTPPGASASTFTHDALGRPLERTTGADSLTYAYIGAGLTSYASIPDSGDATYAFVDATGSRVALATGSTRAWTAFDLHGNLAATTADSATTIVAALRYDPYGQVLDSYTAGSGATDTPWRYQGRLDLSPDADDPLYDYGARRYRPSLGAFTQLDSYAGQAVNPLSMNRFLYAHANPTTLIDPTGHCVGWNCTLAIDNEVSLPKQGKQATATRAAATTAARQANQRATSSVAATKAAATPSTLSSVYLWQGMKSLRSAFDSPDVYIPNPSNLPWVGMPLESFDRRDRLGVGLAAHAAARQIDAHLPPEILLWGAGFFGTVSVAAMLVRAGHAAATIGLGNACIAYCDDLAVAAEGLAGAPPRMPTASTSIASDGVELSLRYKPGWTEAQRAAAVAKVEALGAAETLVVTAANRSGPSGASIYRRAGGVVPEGMDVDHVIDLQLGGQNTITNLRPLDSSVNRSLGAQIACQLQGVPTGTSVASVKIC